MRLEKIRLAKLIRNVSLRIIAPEMGCASVIMALTTMQNIMLVSRKNPKVSLCNSRCFAECSSNIFGFVFLLGSSSTSPIQETSRPTSTTAPPSPVLTVSVTSKNVTLPENEVSLAAYVVPQPSAGNPAVADECGIELKILLCSRSSLFVQMGFNL